MINHEALSLKGQLILRLKEYNLVPQHSMGQNFLIDSYIIDQIIEAFDWPKDIQVLEIGPGMGALSTHLGARANHLLLVEKDQHFVLPLQDLLKAYSYTLCSEDFLQFNAQSHWDSQKPSVVFSNLPYYVMTPIIMKLMKEFSSAQAMIFMVEEEALQRLFAPVGVKSYGPLAIMTSIYGTKQKICDVRKDSFWPEPHTQSAVIKLTKHHQQEGWPDYLPTLINRAFTQRRKTLWNNWKNFQGKNFHLTPEYLEQLLIAANLDLQVRAEKVTPEQYLAIGQWIGKNPAC